MKECIVCGKTITHHHKYCEEHYPKKSATILNLNNQIRNLRSELNMQKGANFQLRKQNQFLRNKLRNAGIGNFEIIIAKEIENGKVEETL